MRPMASLIGSLVLLTMAAYPVAAAPADCQAARCAVQAAIDANCTCSTGATVSGNHGNYVSCVAHQVKMLSTVGNPPPVPTTCKGQITSCAARSTCGKAGFVTCLIPVFGVCDTSTGMCTTGTLASGLTACAANTDCIVGTKCKIKSSAALCTAAGGSVGAGSTCCSTCVTPAP